MKIKTVKAHKMNHAVVIADIQPQKSLLWKKYLAKKKSFAKAQFNLAEFQRLDEQPFRRWAAVFSGDKNAEAFINREDIHKRQEHWERFRWLCRMRKTNPAEMAFQIQQICIAEERFFWGVVRNFYDTGQAEAEAKYRQALKDMLAHLDAGKDTPPESAKEMFENFRNFHHSAGAKFSTSTKGKPEIVSDAEVKKLYRTLCLRHHPDKTGIYNESLWLRIQNAYECGSLKKLRELLKVPVAKDDGIQDGFSCDEIQSMTAELESRFKPVRAGMRQAKHRRCWLFRSWTDELKEKVKEDILRQLNEELVRQEQQLQAFQTEFRNLGDASTTAGRKRKFVKICIDGNFAKRSYIITLEYGKHEKIVESKLPKQPLNKFVENSIVEALKLLKSPCNVKISISQKWLDVMPTPEYGSIYGTDFLNQFSRHIVNFEPMNRN